MAMKKAKSGNGNSSTEEAKAPNKTKPKAAVKKKVEKKIVPQPIIRFGRTRGKPVHTFRVQASPSKDVDLIDVLVMERDDGESAPVYVPTWACDEATMQAAKDACDKARSQATKAGPGSDGRGFQFSAKHVKNALQPALRALIRGGHKLPTNSEIPPELQVQLGNYKPNARWDKEEYAQYMAEQAKKKAEAAAKK